MSAEQRTPAWEMIDEEEVPDYLLDGAVPKVTWERSTTGGRLSWWPTRRVRKVALFRTITDDGVTVLQEIYEIQTTQRGEPRSERLPNPQLDDIPEAFIQLVEADGLTVATEGHR